MEVLGIDWTKASLWASRMLTYARVYLRNVCWSLSCVCSNLSNMREEKTIIVYIFLYIFVYKILGYHMNLVSIFICRGPWKTYELGMLPLPFPYGGVDIQVDIY